MKLCLVIEGFLFPGFTMKSVKYQSAFDHYTVQTEKTEKNPEIDNVIKFLQEQLNNGKKWKYKSDKTDFLADIKVKGVLTKELQNSPI